MLRGNWFTKAGVSTALWDALGRHARRHRRRAARRAVPARGAGEDLAQRRRRRSARGLRDRGRARLPLLQGEGRPRPRRRRRAASRSRASSPATTRCSAPTRTAGGRCRSRSRRSRASPSRGSPSSSSRSSADDLEGLREVRALGVPLIADESVYSPADVLRIGRLGAADIVSVYVGKSSALERAVESARLAGELGMDVVIGANGEMGIGAAAQLHVACACERISEIPHGIIGHHFYEEDATLADAARHRRRRRAAAGRPRARRRAERRRPAELLVVNAGVQVFVYPEELEHVGPDELAAQVLELGCDAVSVAVAYHRGRRVFPRHRRVSVLTRTTLYLEPDVRATARSCRREPRRRGAACASARHATGRACASARGSSACTTARSPPRIRTPPRGCSTARRRATASARPRRRRSSTSPRSRATSPRSSGREAVDLEAAFYPAWEPSYTLTLALEPLSEEARLLVPQCFCASCRVLFGQDAEARAHAAEGRRVVEGGLREHRGGARRRPGRAARLAGRCGRGGRPRSRAACCASSPPGCPSRRRSRASRPCRSRAADALLFGCGPLGATS